MSDAASAAKWLGVKLSKSEIERGNRREEAVAFAEEVIMQCQQRNFTVKQFQKIVSMLDFERQSLESHAADITKMGD